MKSNKVPEEGKYRTVEHQHDFRILVRLIKIVAPQYYLVSTDSISKGEFIVDQFLKRVEVSNHSSMDELVAGALMATGTLSFKGYKEFEQAFFPDKINDKEEQSIYLLCDLSEKLDRKAFVWAKKALEILFPHRYSSSLLILKTYPWNKFEWRSFYKFKK